MSERYTNKAIRVIFLARYEASRLGSPQIESEHLLLCLLRETNALTEGSERPVITWAILVRHKEFIRKRIERDTTFREHVSTSSDKMPLSEECQSVLANAAEEAEHLCDEQIGLDHLPLGLLREQDCLAAKLLNERGVLLESTRTQIENQL